MGSCCSVSTATSRVAGHSAAADAAPRKPAAADGTASASAVQAMGMSSDVLQRAGPNGPPDSAGGGTATPANVRLSQGSQTHDVMPLGVGVSPTLSVGTLSAGFSGSGGSPDALSAQATAHTAGGTPNRTPNRSHVTPPRTADVHTRPSDGSAPPTASGAGNGAGSAAHAAAEKHSTTGSGPSSGGSTPVLSSGSAPGIAAQHLRAATTAAATPDSGPPAFPSVVITTAPPASTTAASSKSHPFGLPAEPTPVGSFGAVAGAQQRPEAGPIGGASLATANTSQSGSTPGIGTGVDTGSTGGVGTGVSTGSTAPQPYPALYVTTTHTDTPPGSRAPGGGVALPPVRPPLHGQPGSLLSVPYLAPGGGDSSARASTPSHSAGSPKSGMSLMSNDSDPATDRAHHEPRPVPELSISRVPLSPVSAT